MTRDPLAGVLDALAFAADKHRSQRRKDAEASPYFNHPIALTRVLACEALEQDGNILAAAALHDTVEDTETTFEELEQQFGPEIAGIVREVTDDRAIEKAERKRLQIEHAAHASVAAKVVKLADKICNLRDLNSAPPAGWSIERRREYFDWAKQVLMRFVARIPCSSVSSMRSTRGAHKNSGGLFADEESRNRGCLDWPRF